MIQKDKILLTYVESIKPNFKDEDIKTLCWVGDHDVLIIFSDNQMYVYDTFLNASRYIKYKKSDLTEEEWKKEFGRRLYELIQRRFIKESELSKMLNIKPQSLSRYIKGQVMPSAYMLNKLLTILDVRVEDLLFIPFILKTYLKKEEDKKDV